MIARGCVAIGAAAWGGALHADERFDLDEVYELDADGVIELDTRDADVVITGTDRDDVRVEIHFERDVKGLAYDSGGRFAVDVSQRDGDLLIREDRRNRTSIGIGWVQSRYDVRIEAPATASLRLEGDDDHYDIQGIDGAITISADDGAIRLRDCDGEAFAFELEDGSLQFDGGRGTLRLQLDDGRATLRNAGFEEIEVRGSDADLTLDGRLADDGIYDFRLDDGDIALRLDGGGGAFMFALEDGTLRLDGGSGELDLRIDDGDASIRAGTYQRIDAIASDGDIEFAGPLPPGARYQFRLDDGSLRFHAVGGGGRVTTQFDDGGVRADDGYRTISSDRHRATYEWGDGDAEVDVEVNDARVRLSTEG